MEASDLQNSMEMAMRKEGEDRRRKKVDWFEFLPDDILLDILKRVPEAVLCYRAKYVCRRWFDMMSSRISLHHASFIIQNRRNMSSRYVGVREEGEGLQVKDQRLNIPVKGLILSWGNEFLLILDHKRESLYVYNLITKEGSYLPECDSSCRGKISSKCGVALSFDGFKGIYKVVHLFLGPPIQCHILMLGRGDIVSSKWKNIQVPCMIEGSFSFNSLIPATVGGRYIYWDVQHSKQLVSMDVVKDAGCYKQVVSLDVVKEEIIQMRVPGYGKFYVFFEMGGSLALFDGVSRDKVDVWILRDFKRMKWEKMQSVTIANWFQRRYPVCGVMMRYVILESVSHRGMFYYDLKKGVVEKLDIQTDSHDSCLVHSSPTF